MYNITIENYKIGEVAEIKSHTVDEAIDAVGAYLEQYATIDTKNYLSIAETNAIVECIDYAIDQIESSCGDVQVFHDLDPDAQLEMVNVIKDLSTKFKEIIADSYASGMIIE